MSKTKIRYYYHQGGGTMVGGARNKYPSDDMWARFDGSEIVAHSTADRHFDLPFKVKSAEQLRRLIGVGKVTTLRPNASEATKRKANRKP